MVAVETFRRRRAELLADLEDPLLLFAGGAIPRNYPANPYPYRADGTFLYFFPNPEPDSVALLDPASGEVTLFLHERTAADALWHGPVPGFDIMAERTGVDRVLPVEQLQAHLRELLGKRKALSLAVADPKATALAASLTGADLAFEDPARVGHPELLERIARMRLHKDEEELAVMRRTAEVTRQAHLGAIVHTRPGIYERELAGIVEGTFARHGCVAAYNTILSVRGEVLHNHSHENVLREGDIVLLDAGAEAAEGYCSDVTRSWPVGGAFGVEGAEIYEIVLAAQLAAIDAVAPGVRYRDVHLAAARVIAEGLLQMRILRGSADEILETGAQALFFPHGVGHQIGLDVHDMEAFGDRIHYPGDRQRSEQFGLCWLRMDMDLAPGMTFTIEPGIYFVPAILHDAELRARWKSQVDWSRAESFLTMHGLRGFGGIRIEDDVHCTAAGTEVLTAAIPKDRLTIEAMSGCLAR